MPSAGLHRPGDSDPVGRIRQTVCERRKEKASTEAPSAFIRTSLGCATLRVVRGLGHASLTRGGPVAVGVGGRRGKLVDAMLLLALGCRPDPLHSLPRESGSCSLLATPCLEPLWPGVAFKDPVWFGVHGELSIVAERDGRVLRVDDAGVAYPFLDLRDRVHNRVRGEGLLSLLFRDTTLLALFTTGTVSSTASISPSATSTSSPTRPLTTGSPSTITAATSVVVRASARPL